VTVHMKAVDDRPVGVVYESPVGVVDDSSC
jgi:hypothetical protein